MSTIWTSTGKKSASSRAVGTAPAKLGQNVLWDVVAMGGPPTQQDVIDNKWPVGTIVYGVQSS